MSLLLFFSDLLFLSPGPSRPLCLLEASIRDLKSKPFAALDGSDQRQRNHAPRISTASRQSQALRVARELREFHVKQLTG
jgi:hypothetical protein